MTLGIGRSLRRAISVTTGVVLIASLGAVGSMPASAAPAETCKDVAGFDSNLEEDSRGDFGSIDFTKDASATLVVSEGYEVSVCLKATSDGPEVETYTAGTHTLTYGADNRGLSHYDFTFIKLAVFDPAASLTGECDLATGKFVVDYTLDNTASVDNDQDATVTFTVSSPAGDEFRDVEAGDEFTDSLVLAEDTTGTVTISGKGDVLATETFDVDCVGAVIIIEEPTPAASAMGRCYEDALDGSAFAVKYILDNSDSPVGSADVTYTVVVDGVETEVVLAAGEMEKASFIVAEDSSSTLLISVGGDVLVEKTFEANCDEPGGFVDDCPTGSTFVAKYNTEDGEFVFDEGDDVITFESIELDEEGEVVGGTFTVEDGIVITLLVIKGGNDSVEYAVTADANGLYTFSNEDLPEVGSGNIPGISNIQFCFEEETDETTVIPVRPDVVQSECEGVESDEASSFEIVATPGVEYSVDGVVVTGVVEVADGSTVTVTAVPTGSNKFAGEDQSIDFDLVFTTPDCDVDEVTVVPVRPIVVQSQCEGVESDEKSSFEIVATPGVEYVVDDVVVTGVVEVADGSTVTVTAVPTGSNMFAGEDQSIEFDLVFTTPDCEIGKASVTPVAPVVGQSACVGGASNEASAFQIVATAGVVYSVNGAAVTGTQNVADGARVTVVATPTAGNEFANDDDQRIEYSLAFGTPSCTTVSGAIPTVTQAAAQPRALARTGVELWSVALIAGLLLASGAAMVGLTTTGNAKGRRQA